MEAEEACHGQRVRSRKKRSRSGNLCHAPVEQHGDAISDQARVIEVVRHKHHRGRVLRLSGDDRVAHVLAQRRIECGEGLVEQKCSRASRDGASQGHPMTLTAAE